MSEGEIKLFSTQAGDVCLGGGRDFSFNSKPGENHLASNGVSAKATLSGPQTPCYCCLL